MTSARSMHEAGHSKLALWDTPEGRGGVGGGTWVGMGEHMYTHGWFTLMYGKNHNTGKQLASNEINFKKYHYLKVAKIWKGPMH